MGEKAASRQRRSVSLSVKLNLLLAVIILAVSLTLINITYHAYTETAYARICLRLTACLRPPTTAGRSSARTGC